MRNSGILLHITSLPSPYGIGTMGRDAYRFVDFLKRTGQSFWQVLPILTTGYGDSPYQSFSTFAGNPYLIDLDILCEDGLLMREEYGNIHFGEDPCSVDYSRLFNMRFAILRIAFERSKKKDQTDFRTFCEANHDWLDDLGTYMAVKAHFGNGSFHSWPDDIRLREPEALMTYGRLLENDILFHKYVQYLFFGQWRNLKKYANEHGIRIIGDIPIYVADDSADMWTHMELFWLDEKGLPVKVAGFPPDAFTDDGQLWGNPLYLWEAHKAQKYEWWHKRLAAALEMYDVLRIDHFRGFESFYAVNFGETTARNGEWIKGPGLEVFSTFRPKIEGFRIIAEDLGYMNDDVRALLADSGFPGMKVMLFGFGGREGKENAPGMHTGNCISYIGTHDNETFMGWLQHVNASEAGRARRYMRLSAQEGYHWGAIRALLSTGSILTIMQMQDILGLDNSARMNTPSTLGGNWQWRLKPDWLTAPILSKLRLMTKTYARQKKPKRKTDR